MPSVPIMIIFLFLSYKSNLSAATINVNSSLTTAEAKNSTWSTSPSGDFAIGFLRLDNANHFLLAIWYDRIPEMTVVWYANGNSPVPSGSKVELTADKLVLINPEGRIIWQANITTTILSAEMRDTGNFVLLGTDSTPVWESFRNPTDTILPTQTLKVGDKMFSRLTETNYMKGRYELHFDGNLSLIPTAWPSENKYKAYLTSESGDQLVFNRSSIYIAKANGETAQIPDWTSQQPYDVGFYYRATLDFDGLFTQYRYSRGSRSANGTWRVIQSVPANICIQLLDNIGGGTCGFNSYCRIQNSRPSCECPPGYVFADPTNKYGGCKATHPQGCGSADDSKNPEDLYEFEPLDDINFPFNDYEMLWPYNETQCKDSCLQDCNCGAVVFNGLLHCWKKRVPLSFGRSETISGIFYTTMFFKVRKQVPSGFLDSRGKKDGLTILLGLLLGGSATINLLVLIFSSRYLLSKRQRQLRNVQDSNTRGINLQFVTYKELKKATDGFKEELGRGSFGIVYKGVWKFGLTKVVAVKKLDKLAQEREKEFRTEVNSISNTHHKNLVKLLAYCDEGTQRLLIYEFMSNGTLADFLFALPRPDWKQRIKIVLGIARGLLYLHEECDVPIIHCDIKPQNILLDEHLTAKISDFGLAKLLLSNQTGTRTMIRGTRGYVAPEWFKNVPITAKVDVYSFGVMLLEIICCRKSVVMELEEEEKAILTDWAYDCFVGGRFDLLVENDGAAMSDKDRLERWLTIAIWCIQEDPSKRPTMKMVMEMLEGFVGVPSPPNPSFF